MSANKSIYINIILKVALIGIIAIVSYYTFFHRSKVMDEKICKESRNLIENASRAQYEDTLKHAATPEDLVKAGYLEEVTLCPAGGTYQWLPFSEDIPMYREVLSCSIHGSTGAKHFAKYLQGLYDIDLDSLDAGWHLLRSAVNLEPEDIGKFDIIADIMIYSDEGKWVIYSRSINNKFESVGTIEKDTDFWIRRKRKELTENV